LTTAAVAAVLLLTSCARTSVKQLGGDPASLSRPDVIVVHDFSISPDQVELDHTIGLRLQEMLGSSSDSKERMRVAQQISGVVTKNLLADLRQKGYPAVPAMEAPPGGRSLAIQGQFFSIDQGSQRRRMIIGFGMGASEVRALVQVFEMSPGESRLIDDFYATVESSRRPGMGPMAGGGAAVGSAATSAVLGGTLGLVGANGQSVEADARHLADTITDELVKFFDRQGWAPPK